MGFSTRVDLNSIARSGVQLSRRKLAVGGPGSARARSVEHGVDPCRFGNGGGLQYQSRSE